MRILLLVIVAVVVVTACGGGSQLAPSGTSTPGISKTIMAARVASGRSDRSIAGATVELVNFGQVVATTTSGPDGTFSLTSDQTGQINVKAEGFVTYENVDAVTSTVLLIEKADLAMYQQMARYGLEQPDNLRPIQNLPTPPPFYVKNTLEDGTTVPQNTVDRAINGIKSAYAQAGVSWASFIVGPEARVSDGFTVLVEFRTDLVYEGKPVCGLGALYSIKLQFGDRPGAACSAMFDGVVIHESCHSFGCNHTTGTDRSGRGVMDITIPDVIRASLVEFSPDEKVQIRYIYSRKRGNMPDDRNPATRSSLMTSVPFREQP